MNTSVSKDQLYSILSHIYYSEDISSELEELLLASSAYEVTLHILSYSAVKFFLKKKKSNPISRINQDIEHFYNQDNYWFEIQDFNDEFLKMLFNSSFLDKLLSLDDQLNEINKKIAEYDYS